MHDSSFKKYIVKQNCIIGSKRKVYIFAFICPLSETEKDGLALYLRRHYATDDLLESKAKFHSVSREECIQKFLLPDPTGDAPMPSVASGEFGEILFSDIIEKEFGFFVPRLKFLSKVAPYDAIKLIDIMGFKVVSQTPNENDVLCLAEVKTSLTNPNKKTLREAYLDITKRKKDARRVLETIEYYYLQAMRIGDIPLSESIQRFAAITEIKYTIQRFACSVVNANTVPSISDFGFDINNVEADIELVHLFGSDIKELEKDLYKRCK